MATTRTAIIAGNWKMNYGPRKAAELVAELLPGLNKVVRNYSHIKCILCPPTISLQAVREVLDTQPTLGVELGAQNMYFEEKGAFTGETSPEMVKELCSAVILGHSERRMYFGETDEQVNQKVQAALQHGLFPIVCLGENREQYEAGLTATVIQDQVKSSLAHFTPEQAGQIAIAYEPIWAIGTGKAATVEDAERVTSQIRQLYQELYGVEAAAAVRILYGGSVTAENISNFMAQPDIDGVLVGGASLKSDFVELLKKSAQ